MVVGPRPDRVAVAAPAGVAVVVIAALVLRVGHYALDSDSVAQQSILMTWLRQGHGVTYLPVDTWLLKLPVYGLVEPLPLTASARVLLETILLDGLAYALLALALLRIHSQLGLQAHGWDVVLPLAWLVTLSGGVGYYFSVMPNFRNIEIGLAYLLLSGAVDWVAAARTVGGISHRGPRLVAATAAMGVLWLDDPYFGLVMAAPVAVLAVSFAVLGGREARYRRACLELAGCVAASMMVTKVLTSALAAVGVVVVPVGVQLADSLTTVDRNLRLVLPAVGAQIGWGQPGLPGSLSALVAVAVLAAAVTAGLWLGIRASRSRQPALMVFALAWVLVGAALVANGFVVDVSAGRYLMPGLVSLALVLATAGASVRQQSPRLATAVTGLFIVGLPPTSSSWWSGCQTSPATRGSRLGSVRCCRSRVSRRGMPTTGRRASTTTPTTTAS